MTAQNPDVITVDEREGWLLCEPLGGLLGSWPGAPALVADSSACWRGYVATWRVSDGVLHLDAVRGWVTDHRPVDAAEIFPGLALPAKATWVTGTLRVGFGAQVHHVHSEYESTWEEELLLEVAAGEVRGRRSQMPSPPSAPFDPDPAEGLGVLVPPSFPEIPPWMSTSDASADRVLIAAVDLLLTGGTTGAPSSHAPPELIDADARAIGDALAATTVESRLGSVLHGDHSGDRVIERLYWWAYSAVMSIDRGAPLPSSPLPPVARYDEVASAWAEIWRAHPPPPAYFTLYEDDDDDPAYPRPERWMALVAEGAEAADLLWTAASLVAALMHQRAGLPDEYRGTVAPVLHELGRRLPGGILAWTHPAGLSIPRPVRHSFRAFFDGGSGVLLWNDIVNGNCRWDYDVDHLDLPIPMVLAEQIEAILTRFDETIPVRNPELPLVPEEATLLEGAYRLVIERLRSTLGTAYAIDDREAGKSIGPPPGARQ